MCVCVLTGVEAWLAVVTSLAIYAQTDDPGWHVPAPTTLSHILSLYVYARKRKRNRQSSGRKKGDIAASAQQSCRSIHQKMETNFLSVVVSPVDVIVLLLLLLLLVALRLLHRRRFFSLCSFFSLAFLCHFCFIVAPFFTWLFY